MNWLHYLLEANIYLGIFYVAYFIFLKRDTHYQLSRAYIISCCVVSFLLPVLQIGALRSVNIEHQTAITFAVPEQISITSPIKVQPHTNSAVTVLDHIPVKHTTATVVAKRHLTLEDGLVYAYIFGVAVSFILLLIKFIALFRLIDDRRSVKNGKYQVIYLSGSNVAFSFFNYLFIGEDTLEANTIITHELVHIRQKHSLDIIFIEVLKVVNWFNPFVYMLQNSLKTIHEYIADEQTAAHETNVLDYASFLVKHAYGAGGISITHSFFNYNLLKKRIIMLNQQRSGNFARLKYLVAIPIFGALLCSSTLTFSKNYGWVDLAPAKTKAATHAITRKRLRITQNGTITISDQIAVDQKNKKVVYTAATITDADRKTLAKDQHIKVEVVEDSTMFTTKDGEPMLPIVNADGYYFLDHYLHKNVHYVSAKGDKGGLVVIEFMLNNDRHVTNARITQSGGVKFDALALNAFNSYKGIVNDDPGKTLKLGVYFFTNDYSIFKTDSLGKDPEFGGEVIITDHKYPFNVTSKGYEFDESAGGLPNMDKDKNGRVVIYDKNDEGTWYFQNKCTATDLQMLKDKYGYTFPSSSSFVLKFMHPVNVKNSRLAYGYDLTSYLDEPYNGNFYEFISDSIRYPEQEIKLHTGSVVVLNFRLNNDKMISDVTVSKSGGKDFDAAAIAALRSYKTAINDNGGDHTIAIVFCVADKSYRPKVNASVKKDGYVGELAVAEVKSPFKFITKK